MFLDSSLTLLHEYIETASKEQLMEFLKFQYLSIALALLEPVKFQNLLKLVLDKLHKMVDKFYKKEQCHYLLDFAVKEKILQLQDGKEVQILLEHAVKKENELIDDFRKKEHCFDVLDFCFDSKC